MMKNMQLSSSKISYISLLIAMSIVLTRLASIRIAIGGVEGIRIGFGKLPIILGGLMLGPLYGGLIGAIADMVGYIIQPIGPYMPHFTVISALTGIFPFLVMHILGKDDYHIVKLAAALGFTLVITDLLLTSYALHVIFEIPWQVLIIPRLFSVPITIILYTYVIQLFVRRNIIQIAHLS